LLGSHFSGHESSNFILYNCLLVVEIFDFIDEHSKDGDILSSQRNGHSVVQGSAIETTLMEHACRGHTLLPKSQGFQH
jgi:hypothetical protein